MDAVALHSGEYVERFKSFPISRVERLVDRMDIGPSDTIADFGCGTGFLLHALGKRPRGHYYGVDFSPDFIAAASEIAKDKEDYSFHCRDIVAFCADHQGELDIAATLDFSEHIDDVTFREVYGAIRSSLKPDGRLYLHTPNLAFFMERLKDKGILKQFPEHIAVRTADENVKMLRECGFRSVKVERIAHYNVLKYLHPLSKVSDLFAARLWIEASR